MRELKFEGNFLYYVNLIKRMQNDMVNKMSQKLNITAQETDILLFLRDNPEYDMACDIAKYKDVSRAYVSKAIELLNNRGYIELVIDKNDRRCQHIKITKDTQTIANKLHTAQMGLYKLITAYLTDGEISTLMTLLGKCAKSVENAKNNF